MIKNKYKIIVSSTISIIIIIFFTLTFLKLNKLQNKVNTITWEDIVDITQYQKDFDFKLFEDSIIKNLWELDNNIVAIYAKKSIEIFQEWEELQEDSKEDSQENSQKVSIETVSKLEGNGIILTNDWYILTNKHVVQDENAEYKIISNLGEFPVDKIRYDVGLDLAVIKIKVKENLTPAKIKKIKEKNRIWQTVIALKRDPDINETIVKMWIINSLNQKFKIENNNIYVWFIKTSTAIEPWFSWWPLVDLNWEIIWINTAIDNIEYGASYSLPINQEFINQTIASIKESGSIIRPIIWIKYEAHPMWIKVTLVESWSNAEKAWLEVSDIIFSINNIDINYNNFLYELYTYKANKEVIFNIQKGNHKQEIQITLWTKK